MALRYQCFRLHAWISSFSYYCLILKTQLSDLIAKFPKLLKPGRPEQCSGGWSAWFGGTSPAPTGRLWAGPPMSQCPIFHGCHPPGEALTVCQPSPSDLVLEAKQPWRWVPRWIEARTNCLVSHSPLERLMMVFAHFRQFWTKIILVTQWS